MGVEAIENVVFAALFLIAAPSLSGFLYRHTRCRAAAILVSVGMSAAAIGLVLLGLADRQYLLENPDGYPPYANAALTCQLAGAFILGGSLLFTAEYSRKLRESGARDPSLRSTPLGFRYRV